MPSLSGKIGGTHCAGFRNTDGAERRPEAGYVAAETLVAPVAGLPLAGVARWSSIKAICFAFSGAAVEPVGESPSMGTASILGRDPFPASRAHQRRWTSSRLRAEIVQATTATVAGFRIERRSQTR